MATHSTILAWKIPWTEEPGGLWSMGLQRVGHDWASNTTQLLKLIKEIQNKPSYWSCKSLSWMRMAAMHWLEVSFSHSQSQCLLPWFQSWDMEQHNSVSENLRQFSSVIQLCLTLCKPMDCSTPGFPVHHHLSELAQTHVHQVIPSNHLILCLSLLLLPSILPSIRVFSNESVFNIRGPKYWSFNLSISPSNEYSGLIP